MTKNIRITALVENTAGHGVLGEHGLAYWVETPAGAVLLDTGQGEVLLRNARSLDIRLSDAKAIILSHGHYDHTGGLDAAATEAKQAAICLHAAAIEPKYTRRPDGQVRSIGMSDSSRQMINQNGRKIVWVEGPAEIMPGLCATGPIPRLTDFENTGGEFFLDPDCSTRDPIIDDQAVYFETPEGTVVLMGCAHSGVVNSLMYVREIIGQRPIHAVVGGTHLLSANETRMAATIDALRRLDVRKIGMAHCTGFAAMARFYQEFAGRCFHCAAGTRMEFEL